MDLSLSVSRTASNNIKISHRPCEVPVPDIIRRNHGNKDTTRPSIPRCMVIDAGRNRVTVPPIRIAATSSPPLPPKKTEHPLP
jgi:hypothetical protein